jgi:hypothetical protein
MRELNRNCFLKKAWPTVVLLFITAAVSIASAKPNVLFILKDQWRAQATGYAGDPNGATLTLDVNGVKQSFRLPAGL